MKAIVVTDQAAGTAGMKLVERPEPQAAINDVVVRIHASGFVPTEMAWPSTWTDRLDRDRTPSIPGHELAGVVTALGYGTTGLSVGQRVFGLTDWTRDGTLAEYAAVEARNLAPLPGDVEFTVGASLPISGLTAWQGLFQHGRLQAGQSVLAHGAAGAVGSMVTQLAREAGAYVIGTGRAADRQTALDFGAQEFVDLENGHTKDGFQWEEHEEIVLELLKEELDREPLPLLSEAEGHRTRVKQEDVRAGAQIAIERTADVLERDAAPVIEEQIDEPDPGPTPDALPPAELASRRLIEIVCDGVPWQIELELSTDPAVSEWLYVSDAPTPATGGPRTLGIRIGMAHPFMERFAGTGDAAQIEPLLRVAAALALAEITAREAGVRFAGSIRLRVNQLLREALCNP